MSFIIEPEVHYRSPRSLDLSEKCSVIVGRGYRDAVSRRRPVVRKCALEEPKLVCDCAVKHLFRYCVRASNGLRNSKLVFVCIEHLYGFILTLRVSNVLWDKVVEYMFLVDKGRVYCMRLVLDICI